MMMRNGTVAVALALVSTACARPPSTGLPAPVASTLAGWADECRAANGTPRTDNAVRRSDLNGDSRDDYVLFLGWLACDNAPSVFGDREKTLMIFAGDDAGGARPAFDDQVYDARIEESGTAKVLWLTTSGSECARPPAQSFSEETFCDRALVWNPSGRFELSPVETARIIE
jgi:hypothetical protein